MRLYNGCAGFGAGRWCVLAPSSTLLGAMLASLLSAQTPSQPLYPLAIAAPPDGRLFVGDRNLPGVWLLDQGKLSLFFEGSKRFRTPLNALRCLAIDQQGRLLAGDSSTRQIYRFDDQHQPRPLAQPWDAEHNLGPLGIPMGIVHTRAGQLVVSDLEFHCLWKIPPEGGEPTKWVEMQAPTGLAVDDQDRVWVVSRVENPLRRVLPDGTVEVVVQGRPFEFPHSVALDDQGTALVVDGYAKTIWKVEPGKAPEAWIKHPRFVNPVDIKRAADGWVVVDPRANAIFRIDATGNVSVIELAAKP
ncbi:MAG: hypothetical protein KatS3mg110_2295 [Pirellulaceae bacterium]|nr:MAG: hypothetical protein KatS3mg110_2295 [Pirellulaceae bacterium]